MERDIRSILYVALCFRLDCPRRGHTDRNAHWTLTMWRLWAKSLGEKDGATDAEADKIAIIRSIFMLLNAITCCFIIAGNIHHW